MTEPNPTYHAATHPGFEIDLSGHRMIEAKDIEALRRTSIDVVRRCDLILYGRDDKTIPRRNR